MEKSLVRLIMQIVEFSELYSGRFLSDYYFIFHIF